MAERDYTLADTMSEHEALMWNVEKDPWLNPSGASIVLLDQPVDADLFTQYVRQGVAKIPRLRQRVAPGLGRLAPPSWVPDAEFDLDYHLRFLDLPGPASIRDVLDLAASLYAEPLDRTRPLWRFVAIGGIEGGRGAVWAMFHHAVSDGIGQLRMAELYQQLSRDEAPPEPVDLEALIADDVAKMSGKEQDPLSALVSTARRSMSHVARRNLKVGRRLLGEAAMIPADPKRIVDQAQGAIGAVQATAQQLTTGSSSGGSELWAARSRHRRLEHVRVPLEPLKAAAAAHGGSVNDAFLAGLTEAAVRYHADHDHDVETFNSSFVVSTRTDNRAGGNAFVPVPVELSGAELSFGQRLAATAQATAAAKTRAESSGGMGAVSGLANLLPTSMITQAARSQAQKLDFVTSNLRGAPFELFCAGARVEASIPMGPLAGTPVNITALSYDGDLDLGIFIDPVAIEDPVAYRDHVEAAFVDLIETATPKPKPKRSGANKAAGTKRGGKSGSKKSASGKSTSKKRKS